MNLPVEQHQTAALLRVLAESPDPVSLPRLCKRLDLRMSVLLRLLAWLGEAPVGAQPGAGWVKVEDAGGRQVARLTTAGLQAARTRP